jgi:hypothetical protein
VLFEETPMASKDAEFSAKWIALCPLTSISSSLLIGYLCNKKLCIEHAVLNLAKLGSATFPALTPVIFLYRQRRTIVNDIHWLPFLQYYLRLWPNQEAP